jgi:carbon-monoxide dehydrogenase medium subunit
MSSRVLPDFDLLLPGSLDEAVGLLAQHGKQAAVMAGGTDLLILMKAGLKSDYVLSLGEIDGLDYVEFDAGKGLSIGAMATLAQVVDSKVVNDKYHALWYSAFMNGTPQTRNSGTVVGNILRASPAGDCCAAALAHGGSVVLQGPSGQREVDLDEFWLDYRKTARKPDEVAVELKLNAPEKGAGSGFAALTRSYQDLSKINAAASLVLEGNVCKKARLVMGAVAPVTLRLAQAEKVIEGQEINDALLEKLADAVRQEVKPIDDVRSTAEYRREVSGVLAKQVVRDAMKSVAGPCPYSCFLGA